MSGMTHRERVWKVLNHEEADRVPMDLGSTIVTSITKETYEKLEDHLGIPHETRPLQCYIQGIVEPSEEILKKFDVDLRRVNLLPPRAWLNGKDAFRVGCKSFIDEWGITMRLSGTNFYDPVVSPIKEPEIEALEKHTWPDVHDPSRYEGLEERAKYLYENTDYAIVADLYYVFDSFFNRACQMRGFTEFYADLLLEPEFANALLDKLEELYTGLYEEYLARVGKYIQLFCIADDLGSQRGLLISRDMYREFIKPRQKRMIAKIKSMTDAKVMMHSCGSVYDLIPDFIDVGLDVLEAVQTSAANMDPEKLGKEFGDKLTFFGAIDVQQVLSRSNPEGVEAEVHRVIQNLAPGGGYILSATHNLQTSVSPENIITMYKAAHEYGKYPIK